MSTDKMNPPAGTFNPSKYSPLQQSTHKPTAATKARRDSLEPHSDSTAAELEQLKKDLEVVKDGTLRELSQLRHDVDLLLRGGWTVKVGPFQTVLEPVNKRLQHSTASSESDQVKLTANEAAKSESKTPEGDLKFSKITEPGVNGAATTPKGSKVSPSDFHQFPIRLATIQQKIQAAIDLSPSPSRTKSPVPKSFPKPDDPMPSIEDAPSQASYTPLIIKRLDKLHLPGIPTPAATRTFSLEVIDKTLGGNEFSPGFYYVPPSHGACVLDSRAYFAIDATTDPYLPSKPGEHGAKLIPFIRVSEDEEDPDDDAILNTPVFVRASNYGKKAGKNEHEYVYFGMYSQLRFSDRLDYDRMVEAVPNHVKMHWAEQLADIGRPAWVTKALMNHFWKKADYEDDDEVEGYLEYLKEAEDEAKLKVSMLKKETILEAFENADVADPPGLRLWWEYLECVGYNENFYKMMVKAQDDERQKRR